MERAVQCAGAGIDGQDNVDTNPFSFRSQTVTQKTTRRLNVLLVHTKEQRERWCANGRPEPLPLCVSRTFKEVTASVVAPWILRKRHAPPIDPEELRDHV